MNSAGLIQGGHVTVEELESRDYCTQGVIKLAFGCSLVSN